MMDDSDKESEDITTFYYPYDPEPFADYQIQSKEPGVGFYSFVLVYTLLAFLFIAPLVSWSRNQEEKKLKILESDDEQEQEQQQEQKEHKESDHRRSSNDDNNQIPSTLEAPNNPSRKGGEDNIIKSNNENQETHNHNGDTVRSSIGGDRQRNNKKNNVRSQMTSTSDMDKLSSPSVGIENTDIITKNSKKKTSLRSVVLRELDQSYPDQDPDFQNRIRLRFSVGAMPQQQSFRNNNQHKINNNPNRLRQDQQRILQQQVNMGGVSRSGGGSKQPTETSSSVLSGVPSAVPSGVPSAATTSKIHQKANNNPSDKGFSKLVLDVGGRRWKNRRPIGRVDVIQNVVVNNSERNSSSVIAGNKTSKGESISPPGPKKINIVSSSNVNSLIRKNQQRQSRGVSDVASSILSEQCHQLHHQPQIQIDISMMKKYQLEQQQHFLTIRRLQQQQRRYSQQRRNSRNGSRSISEQSASVMSSIIDDISPDDAPGEANDPGRGNAFLEPDEKYWITETQYDHQGGNEFGTAHAGCCSSPLESLLSLALPDVEKWKVFQASIPLALGASSEALFRLITIAFISQNLGTESMIAFLLVGLFVRLTSEELAGAIIDALSSFLQASLDRSSIDTTKSTYIAGQYIQLAVILQLVSNIPLLLFWALLMERFVMWLVDDPTIAKIAQDYACIVVFAYMVQALSRTLTVVFHICGHEHFESVIDLIAAAMQVIAIACVVVLMDRVDLTTVGGIQVLINVASAIAKIAYPAARGWMRPFYKGLIRNVALWNYKIGIWHLLKATVPLLLGTVLEYGEWELLTLCVRRLGPAEVATWALLGAFWDFFEALTEGIGEAAANQVAYLLSRGQIDRAKKLCYGAIYMAVTQAVLVTSALYMSGQYLAVLFTTNPAIQHIMNNTIVLIGFANVIMVFSQITWSLVGAQGRFRLATFVIFFSRWLVTMPCALISIYVFVLDLNAVSGSMVVGYATACCALTFIVLRSDWDRLVRLMQVMNQPHHLVSSAFKQEGEKDAGVDAEVDAEVDDPILGLVNLDDFDDSDDGSDGFGFGDYGDDYDVGDRRDEVSNGQSASLSKKERRGGDNG